MQTLLKKCLQGKLSYRNNKSIIFFKFFRRKKRVEPKKEKLKIHQKIEIVNKIIDETNQNIELTNQEHTGKIELIECKLQQFEEQMKDIQKHSIEFEREFSKYSKKEKVNFYNLSIF